MTLDDFFSLTEMTNGLAVPSRVRELVAVMQKERDCIMKNVGDATRQWSAVASTIATTENKDCLDLFIQLDGLHFIEKWLKDAHNFSNGTSDSDVEESIAHLLRALEKLHVANEKSFSSQILTTVTDFLGRNSSKLQDMARGLVDSWKKDRDNDTSSLNVDGMEKVTDDSTGVSACAERNSWPTKSSCEENRHESTLEFPSPSFGAIQLDKLEMAHISDRNNDFCNKVESPVYVSKDTNSDKSCSSTITRQGGLDRPTDFHELQSTRDVKQTPKMESSPEKLGSLEDTKLFEDKPFPPNSDAADALDTVAKPSLEKISAGADEDSCQKDSGSVDATTIDSKGKGNRDGDGCTSQCRNPSASKTKDAGEFYTSVSQDTHVGEQYCENSKDSSTFLPQIQDAGGIEKLDHQVSELSSNDLANQNNYDFPKQEIHGEPDLIKRSAVELDCGMVDPLELASQVAIEVEREVIGFTEQSCNSSEKVSEGEIQQPDSSHSLSGKQCHNGKGSHKDVANGPYLSAGTLPILKESTTGTENLDAEQMNGTQDTRTSRCTDAAEEMASTEKGLCNFDLNEEVCSEDTDCPGNHVFITASIVSASRAAAAPGLPVSPLQFEGNFGWKGSSATSAFRPASPRRIPEGGKDLSAGGSSSNSNQRHGSLFIDLNVAENGDDRAGDPLTYKQTPESSGLPSVKFSAEASSRRSEHLELDLNQSSEDGDALSNWRTEGQIFPQRIGHHNQAHSSSSRMPWLRNIDLNDQPSFLNSSDNSYLRKLSQNSNAFGGTKPDESISIMGTRVEIRRKDLFPQFLPLPNGRTSELAFDVNLATSESILGMGPALPYAHSPVCGNNDRAPGFSMPLSSTMYGPGGYVPYMTREAPVVPQIVGCDSALPPSLSQPSFFINMAGPTASNVVVGPSRNSFDLNSGSTLEAGNRDSTGLLQFFDTGTRSMDEQLRSGSLHSISSCGLKRKEPDSGWEQHPFKHYAPPQK